MYRKNAEIIQKNIKNCRWKKNSNLLNEQFKMKMILKNTIKYYDEKACFSICLYLYIYVYIYM